MTTNNVDVGRRRFLIGATSAVGAVGAAGIAVPFVASWSPSEKAKSAGASVKFNYSKMEFGALAVVEWRREPIYVVRRTKEALELLEKIPAENLKDATSANIDQQPEYAHNTHRSKNPEFLVIKAVCTHLGCAPKYRPEVGAEGLGKDWTGGFFCACHGSRFDMAGRVMAGSPAGANLEVPPYKFDGNAIIIGEDEGAA